MNESYLITDDDGIETGTRQRQADKVWEVYTSTLISPYYKLKPKPKQFLYHVIIHENAGHNLIGAPSDDYPKYIGDPDERQVIYDHMQALVDEYLSLPHPPFGAFSKKAP